MPRSQSVAIDELVNGNRDEEGAGRRPAARKHLCPALLRRFRNLQSIRHDYPLILVEGAGPTSVRSLTEVMNELLRKSAPRGIRGERIRKRVLSLETEIRTLAAAGGGSEKLSVLWSKAAERLLAGLAEGERDGTRELLDAAFGDLHTDGDVVDCTTEAPRRVLRHVWGEVLEVRRRDVLGRLHGLIRRLEGILHSDLMRSDESRKPDALRSSMGGGFEDAFDFEAMSGILSGKLPSTPIPTERRGRVEWALKALRAQRFFGAAGDGGDEAGAPAHEHLFTSCRAALDAYSERLPEMVGLVKAVRLAELEIENQYEPKRHDAFFGSFDENNLTGEDLALFPSYLVALEPGGIDDGEKAALLTALASDLPLKVLVPIGDLAKDPDGGWPAQLGTMAVGLEGTHVVQTPSSNLRRLAGAVRDGILHSGPALFSVFAPSPDLYPRTPAYLVAAAAMQSRMFPCFVYSPGRGPDWASRFDVQLNPQPESRWPVDGFAYEDDELQRHACDLAFTPLDFLSCDRRYARCFVTVPGDIDDERLAPAHECLTLDPEEATEKIPYVLLVDDDDRLHRVLVASRLLEPARRVGGRWRSLQELGGVDNSHALRVLEREREAWEEEKQKEIAALRGEAPPAGAAAVEAPAAPAGVPSAAPAEAAPESEQPPSDEPWIETVRCTSCDECTKKNNRMFAYDENKQAYFKDPTAGTFRQIVEAAEKCPVCIIHPGKPKNPDEPGLDDLMRRAEPFN